MRHHAGWMGGVGAMFGLLAVLAVTPECSSSSSSSSTSDVAGEGLTPAQVAQADMTPTVPVTLDEIRFSDGQTLQNYLDARGITVDGIPSTASSPAQKLKDVIAAMVAEGINLSDRTKWQVNGQNGLAYSYGAKNQNVAGAPPAGSCTAVVQGLDCSGLVYQAATNAGIPLPNGPASLQGTPAPWNTAIPSSWGLKAISVDGSSPQLGDIVSWGSHIGFIGATSGGTVFVTQSNGTSGPTGCATNSSPTGFANPTRGPRSVALSQILKWFSNAPVYVRLVTSSGESINDAGTTGGLGDGGMASDAAAGEGGSDDSGSDDSGQSDDSASDDSGQSDDSASDDSGQSDDSASDDGGESDDSGSGDDSGHGDDSGSGDDAGDDSGA